MGLRLSAIETWRDDMRAEIVSRLLEQFTEKINMNLSTYFPKVARIISDYDQF
jgi:hypothetical protein